jgi:hypothetical protein
MNETKPTPPREPYCVNKFANTNTCSSFEIDSYNREVDEYNRDVANYRSAAKQYIDELNRYVTAASRYAQCEVSTL